MWQRLGRSPSPINWRSAGRSFRRMRSPVAPKMTNRHGSILDLRTRCSWVMAWDSLDRDPGRIEVGEVDAEAAVLRRGVADRAPGVARPMDRRRGEELDPQDAARRQ